MKIGQLIYAYNDKSGWSVTHRSGTITQRAEDFFCRICYSKDCRKQGYTYDIEDGIFLLSRLVDAQKDHVGRSTFLMHGYVFYEEDYEELFSNVRRFLSIDKFVSSYGEKVTPMVHLPEIPYTPANTSLDMHSILYPLIASVYNAIAEDKSVKVVVPSADYDTMRAVLCAVYNHLPVSMRQLVTFGNTDSDGKWRMVFVTALPGDASECYLLSDGIPGEPKEQYVKLAKQLIDNPTTILEMLDSYMKESAKRNGFNSRCVKESLEKYFLSSGESTIQQGDEFGVYHDIFDNRKYTDKVYAKQLSELVTLFEQKKKMISLSTLKPAISAYGQAHDIAKDAIVRLVLHALTLKPDASEELLVVLLKTPALWEKVGETITARPDNYEDVLRIFVTVFFQNADYAAGVLNYLGDSKYRTFQKNMLQAFITLKYVPEDEVQKILKNLYQTDMFCYQEMEAVLVKAEKSTSLEQFYLNELVQYADTPQVLLDYRSRLNRLGIDISRFVSTTVHQFVALCKTEHQRGSISDDEFIKKVDSYLQETDEKMETYLPDLMYEIKQKYWKQFSWETFSLSEDISGMYVVGNPLCQTATVISQLAREIKQGKTIGQSEENYFDYLCGAKIKKKADRNAVIRKLTAYSKEYCNFFDYDLFFAEHYEKLSPKQLMMQLVNETEFLEYCKQSLKKDSHSMLQYEPVFKAVYQCFLKKQKLAETNDKKENADVVVQILYVLQSYAEEKDNKALLRWIKRKNTQLDRQTVCFVSAMLTLLACFIPFDTMPIPMYWKGVIDTIGVFVVLVVCIVDSF